MVFVCPGSVDSSRKFTIVVKFGNRHFKSNTSGHIGDTKVGRQGGKGGGEWVLRSVCFGERERPCTDTQKRIRRGRWTSRKSGERMNYLSKNVSIEKVEETLPSKGRDGRDVPNHKEETRVSRYMH